MRVTIPDDDSDADALTELANSASTPEKNVSRSSWVRGAVRVALSDDSIAQRIAEAAPDTRETGHGGRRPGSGRPVSRTSPHEGEGDDAVTD